MEYAPDSTWREGTPCCYGPPFWCDEKRQAIEPKDYSRGQKVALTLARTRVRVAEASFFGFQGSTP